MFKKWTPWIGLGVTLLLVSCGTSDKHNMSPSSAAENQQATTGNSSSDMMSGCLMGVMKDVTVTLTDNPSGISADLIASDVSKIDMIRTAVKHMAEMHSPTNPGGTSGGGEGTGGGHDGHHGAGSVSPKGMGMGSGGMMGGGDHGGMMGGGDQGGAMNGGGCNMNMMANMFQGAVLQEQDIEGGARLNFTTQNAAGLDQLRASVRSHFDDMRNGKCPMMK